MVAFAPIFPIGDVGFLGEKKLKISKFFLTKKEVNARIARLPDERLDGPEVSQQKNFKKEQKSS